MRQPGFKAPGLLIIAILLLVGVTGAAPAAAWQAASPAAGTPAVIVVQPTQAPAQPTTVPAGTPVPPAQTDVVTLVLWYQNAADQDIIELYPLATDAGFRGGSCRLCRGSGILVPPCGTMIGMGERAHRPLSGLTRTSRDGQRYSIALLCEYWVNVP